MNMMAPIMYVDTGGPRYFASTERKFADLQFPFTPLLKVSSFLRALDSRSCVSSTSWPSSSSNPLCTVSSSLMWIDISRWRPTDSERRSSRVSCSFGKVDIWAMRNIVAWRTRLPLLNVVVQSYATALRRFRAMGEVRRNMVQSVQRVWRRGLMMTVE